MVSVLVIFSYFWLEFMVKQHSLLSSYDISSSRMVHIETILKFPNYHWSPHGITQNPNIKKQDVISNPQLPWIYTDFTQDWVDEEWVNSFPYYNEKILTKLNIIPNFVKQKIIRGIPISYTNQIIDETFQHLRILKEKAEVQKSNHTSGCKVLNDDLDYVFEKLSHSEVCIFGRTNLLFSFIESHPDVRFYIHRDVLFVKELEKL